MIYFAQAGDGGLVKIGWSRNLASRLRSLHAGQPHQLTVLRQIDAPRWAETWLHHEFASARVGNEWFTFQPEMLTVAPPAAKVGRTASRYHRNAPSTPLHVRVSDDTLAQLRAMATAERRKIAALLALLIDEALEARNRQPDETPCDT